MLRWVEERFGLEHDREHSRIEHNHSTPQYLVQATVGSLLLQYGELRCRFLVPRGTHLETTSLPSPNSSSPPGVAATDRGGGGSALAQTAMLSPRLPPEIRDGIIDLLHDTETVLPRLETMGSAHQKTPFRSNLLPVRNSPPVMEKDVPRSCEFARASYTHP